VSDEVGGADVRDRVLGRAIRRARGGEDRVPRPLCVPLSAAECHCVHLSASEWSLMTSDHL
jgi:hypothetical protein